MSLAFKVVIPARHGSTRLPGKPLLDIVGKPMIAHVCQRALEAKAEQVVVATDDQRIVDTVSALGLQAVMTSPDHQSGTERIEEVARLLGWQADDIVVNLQSDEPLIPPAYIRQVAEALASQNQAGIATLAARIVDADDVFNPNAVKVVVDKDGHALYFSRAPIPWNRALFPDTKTALTDEMPYLRHIGMYAYTVDFLKRYCAWGASPLESIESLEQLRILWHGARIRIVVVDRTPEAGVDTADDYRRVSERLQAR
ncbi:MAG: 3-deoxy-manno-octulosonate cytidylyltransferase [Methylomonas sp.]|nr:3-deoxy-manno-octulosonate cytidylyltransferase [Methylomonas sp.]PPD22356.1 MAG: 3-deoxy-manno-octulosonate cytidylyltransferase [Methylomonas sp.]PPD26859.1 MAG: 3-deoxy-manno-octulosonate cytidylyltransferase [Methylomonas sp.]PPD38766.1 MAG: 3-deoxy-manno-octulosonate cytidylyltransferase [Methylomonas sp.]PPD40190.1 MAG: 3-deoxy-manno-octulosonate cytidylyltransferase [Methylomonas sp.]